MSAVMKEAQTIPTVIPIPSEMMAEIGPARFLAEAESYLVDSSTMAQHASDRRREWAIQIDRIKAMKATHLLPIKQMLENTEALFNPPIEDREAGRELLGKKLMAWDKQEGDRLAAEQAERDAAARKIRQEAEVKAAGERARAGEQAFALRMKARDAEMARVKALAEGNTRAAAAAAAEAAKQSEKADAAIETGNAKAAQIQIEAAASVNHARVAEPVKIGGSSLRTKWVAELLPGISDDDAKKLIVAETSTRPELLGLLMVDLKAICKQAESLHGAMRVPGFMAKETKVISGARK